MFRAYHCPGCYGPVDPTFLEEYNSFGDDSCGCLFKLIDLHISYFDKEGRIRVKKFGEPNNEEEDGVMSWLYRIAGY